MNTSFAERIKRKFGGNLSEIEQRVCEHFVQRLQAALNGQMSFSDAMSDLWRELRILRAADYELTNASEMTSLNAPIENVTGSSSGSQVAIELTSSERAFLEDAEGLIDWVTRNGVSFSVVLQILGHDLSELERDGFSLETAVSTRFVHPKVTGWARRNTDPVGEADEQM